MLRLLTCFFFSSRRRHTRFKCDWSSDVCSSDLHTRCPVRVSSITVSRWLIPAARVAVIADRKSVVSGKSGDLGGRRIIKKKKKGVKYVTKHNGAAARLSRAACNTHTGA